MAGEVGIFLGGADRLDGVEGASRCQGAGGCGDLGLEREGASELLARAEVNAIGARDEADLRPIAGCV